MDLNKYKALCQDYDLIPIKETFVLDTVTPIAAFLNLTEREEEFFLLESAAGVEHLGRYSFIGLKPFLTFISQNGENTISGKINEKNLLSPYDALKRLNEHYRVYSDEDMPFHGGAAGFFSYDSIRFLENVAIKQGALPDSIFLFPSIIVCFDHLKHQVTITVFTSPGEDPEQAYEIGRKEVLSVKEKLIASNGDVQPVESYTAKNHELSSGQDDFIKAVTAAQEYIAAGDIFQVVLSKQFEVPFDNDPFSAYRRLRAANPSPYLFFFKFKDFYLFGSSPEMLVKKDGDKVITYPIAGTRRKTGDGIHDRKAEMELLADVKEKAEHVMLVDLGRNDLGKVCIPGSVKVKEFMEIQKFSHVMHLVSVVEGLRKRDVGPIEVLEAVFPAGTVSGAPKIRAMEIINELETDSRGIYAGAVGYLDFNQNCDFCITIRTVVVKDKIAYLRAGAGIVADSVPEKEYAEVLAKSKILFETLRG